MSGIDDLMANSNDRWVQAVRRSQGIADNGLGEALKTYYTRYFPAGFVILAATGTIGGILAFGASDWQNILVFGFFLAMLGVVIGGADLQREESGAGRQNRKGRRAAFVGERGTQACPPPDSRESHH